MLMKTYLNDLKMRLSRLRNLTSSATSFQARHLPSSHPEVLNYVSSRRLNQTRNKDFSKQDTLRFYAHFERLSTHELELKLDSVLEHPFLVNLPQLSPEEYCYLFTPITLEELSRALKHLNKGLAPGCDGLTAEF